MGTSSARLGPTGRRWRLAKAAASRYLSPEAGGAVDAREVAARYVAALAGEGGQPGLAEALAAFRLTRKVAQNLGAFWSQADSRGWPAALAVWGLQELSGAGPETMAPALGAVLEIPGAGLEQAAAHTALMGLLLELLPKLRPSCEATWPVRRFLAGACQARLALDLGESLEAASSGFLPLRQGLRELADCLDRAVETAQPQGPTPQTPEDWLGLPGWIWVTHLLEGLLTALG